MNERLQLAPGAAQSHADPSFAVATPLQHAGEPADPHRGETDGGRQVGVARDRRAGVAPKRLTPNQLAQLRQLPVPSMGPLRVLPAAANRVMAAAELVGASQAEIVAFTGFTQPYVSDVYRGRYQTISVDNAEPFAAFFGCHVLDLFPDPNHTHGAYGR